MRQIREQPRTLLQLILGLTLKPVSELELCCGAAVSDNLTQPEMADRPGKRRVRHLLATEPDIIASGNAGCSLQLQAHLKQSGAGIPVMHPMELLEHSYEQRSLGAVDPEK